MAHWQASKVHKLHQRYCYSVCVCLFVIEEAEARGGGRGGGEEEVSNSIFHTLSIKQGHLRSNNTVTSLYTFKALSESQTTLKSDEQAPSKDVYNTGKLHNREERLLSLIKRREHR